jgi:hypothetical protein
VLNFQLDPRTVKQVQTQLLNLEKRIKKKIIRGALREVGKAITQVQKGGVTWDDPLMRREIKAKVKTFKRGRYIWLGAGVVWSNNRDWKFYVRANSYDKGWVPYPKGRPSGRKGKGWRKGVKRLGGQKIYKTEFIQRGGRVVAPWADSIIRNYVDDAVKEIRSPTSG